MNQICYVVLSKDNVATAMDDIKPGEIILTGEAVGAEKMTAYQKIPFGHKIALRDIYAGEEIVKYGVPIGVATADIEKGMHIHLHNMKSAYDFRSVQLDPVTVHAKDIEYKIY